MNNTIQKIRKTQKELVFEKRGLLFNVKTREIGSDHFEYFDFNILCGGQNQFGSYNQENKKLIFYSPMKVNMENKEQMIRGVIIPEEYTLQIEEMQKEIEDAEAEKRKNVQAEIGENKLYLSVGTFGDYHTECPVINIRENAELTENEKEMYWDCERYLGYTDIGGTGISGVNAEKIKEKLPNYFSVSFLFSIVNEIFHIDEKKQNADERRKKLFVEAREKNQPVKMSSFPVECEDEDEECTMDIITIWAMPDGTEKVKKEHTY